MRTERLLRQPRSIASVLLVPITLFAFGLGLATSTEARITSIVIDCARSQSPTLCPGQSPTFGGLSFGSVGQYEKLRGKAYGEVDPGDPRNALITDIELAPVNAGGKVEYSMDIVILKPINLSQGNHKLFIDFNNRGGMRFGTLNGGIQAGTTTNNPTTAAHAGTGFLMNLGYTIVANGWDIGASSANYGLTITVPVATNGGATITGPSYEYIVFDNATSTSYSLAYPAATLDKTQATLTVRARLDDAPTTVPASGWDYTSSAGTAIQLAGGTPFQQSYIYEFMYTAKKSGCGRTRFGGHARLHLLPAVRDDR